MSSNEKEGRDEDMKDFHARHGSDAGTEEATEKSLSGDSAESVQSAEGVDV